MDYVILNKDTEEKIKEISRRIRRPAKFGAVSAASAIWE